MATQAQTGAVEIEVLRSGPSQTQVAAVEIEVLYLPPAPGSSTNPKHLVGNIS